MNFVNSSNGILTGEISTWGRPVTESELVKALEKALSHLNCSFDYNAVTTVYESQAQLYREMSEALDKKDSD